MLANTKRYVRSEMQRKLTFFFPAAAIEACVYDQLSSLNSGEEAPLTLNTPTVKL